MALDKEQLNAIKGAGFLITELPSLKPASKITLYKWEPSIGVVSCPNLPADPFSIKRYLARGLRYKPEDLKPQTNGFTCDVCGKTLKTKLALSGHKRTHKEETK